MQLKTEHRSSLLGYFAVISSNMEVKIHRTAVIAASPPSSESLLLPLTVFDRLAADMRIAVLFVFSAPTPTNSELIAALSKTLHLHFPILTARFGGTAHCPCVILGGGGGGALVVEADVDSYLDEHMPLLPSPELTRLHPSTAHSSHLLQVQLTRFRCGGLIVGVTTHHRVADGQSMSSFYVSWGKVSRGITVEPSPNHDRSWLKPRCPPECEFEHWGAEFIPIPKLLNGEYTKYQSRFSYELTSNVMLHYSAEFISSKLKAGMREKLSTFQLLLGHVWRKITISRALPHGVTTTMRVSVNGRARLRPAVPNEFTGNVVLNAYPSAQAGELIEGGLVVAARTVAEAVRRINGSYFQSFIDFGELHKAEKLVSTYDLDSNILCPNLEVHSWLGFQFQEVNFGGGGALQAFLPTWESDDGLVILLPSLNEDGGVDVVVSLLNQHAETLKQISHSLV